MNIQVTKHLSRLWLLPFILLTLLIMGDARAQAPVVGDIAVVGMANISREAILAVSSVRVGQPFSQDIVNRDVAAIQNMGYFQRVTSRTEQTPSGLRVIYEVVENPKITSINITGNTLVPTDKLLDAMRTKAGDVLNTDRIGKDFDAIQQYYQDLGYLAFINTSVTDAVTPEGVMNLPIIEVRIEKFTVTGNKKTRTDVILRELTTKPGDPYNKNTLTEDMYRLSNLGYVEPQTYKPLQGSAPDKIIIEIEVAEKRSGQLEVGAGYSSQQGLIGRVAVSESNIKGSGKLVSASLEIAGRYRNDGVPPVSADLTYYQPWIGKKKMGLSASIYNKTTYRFSSSVVGTSSSDSDAYEVRRGFSLGLSRPRNKKVSLQTSFRLDSIDTFSGKNESATALYQIDAERNSTVAAMGISHVVDTRDTIQDASRGQYVSLGSELGHTNLSGDFNDLGYGSEGRKGFFAKPAAEYRRFFALVPRKDFRSTTRVLAFRVKAGASSGPITFFDQYFVGGADSLRGFGEDRFWGKNMLLANLELRYPIPKTDAVQAVLFMDAGDAWGSELRGDPKRYADYLNWSTHDGDINGDGIKDPPPAPYSIYDAYEYRWPQHDKFKMHFGAGIGIRVKTPIGPIRLDYAGSKEGNRVHFSIAQMF